MNDGDQTFETTSVQNENAIMAQPLNNSGLSMVSLEESIKRAENYVKLQDSIRKNALKLTSLQDWVDEGGKPYLMWSGTSKIARAFGVSYGNLTWQTEIFEDENGKCMDITVSGDVLWQGQQLPEVGSASSRDALWGIRKDRETKEKIYIPLADIDRTDIKKKALTNFLNRGLKSLLGLSFTWGEIAEQTNGRITKDLVSNNGAGVNFNRGSKGGSAISPKHAAMAKEINQMVLAMASGEENVAGDELEKATKYGNAPGVRDATKLSEARIDYNYPRIKKIYDEFRAKQTSE